MARVERSWGLKAGRDEGSGLDEEGSVFGMASEGREE